MNTDNKEHPVQDELKWFKEQHTNLYIENEELQQRIVQLEQERKGIARDAWDAAIRITGHPFGVKGFAPDKATYLSQFEQTKTETNVK